MTMFGSKTVPSGMTPGLDVAVHEGPAPSATGHPVLTFLYFGNNPRCDENCLSIQTGLEVLPGSNLFSQYWYTDQEITQGQYRNVQYSCNPHMLFGHIQLPCLGSGNLEQLAKQTYQEVYGCLLNTDCKHLLRTWNYFPGITNPAGNHTSRYHSFCSARLQAMQESGIGNRIYPAATVIGSQNNFLQIYFLAGNTPGIAVENPRQTSAYDYPVTDAYAPPLFSRGVLKVWGRRTHFYVSGTASIVGHETQHANDIGAQLNESINNVETLVVHANDRHQTQLNAQDDLLYMKVYVRHGRDVPHIKKVLAARLPGTAPRILLLGDMCRDDLLVEIEAFYQA